MKVVYLVARILLGAIFLLSGIDGLVMLIFGKGIIPAPPPTGAMLEMMDALMAMVYLMPAVKTIEVVAGVLLLATKKINLALVLLAPVVFNIVGIHLFVDRSGLPIALVVVICFALVLCSKCEDIKTFLFKS